MNILLKILFSLSLSGSLLILLLLLCKPLYKNILTRKWQYYIWIIVIARLLIPFAPELNLVGTLFQSFDTMKQNTTVASDFDYSYTTTDPELIAELMIEGRAANIVQDTPPIFPSIFSSSFSIQMIFSFFTEYLFFIWLLVVLLLLIRKITIYQSFLSYIKASRVEVSDISLLNRFSELQDISFVRRRIELYTNELISSPLLIGFIHPCIILPTTDISSADFDCTILHELTHYKQMDLFYKWLVQLTVCIHWFNPLVYLMAREINRACELSCDETVIQDLDEDGIDAYGNTLLHTIKIKGTYKSCVASVTLTESKELLMERLAALMDFKKPTRQASVIAILCTIFISFSSIVVGAYPISTDFFSGKESNEVSNSVLSLGSSEKYSVSNSISIASEANIEFIYDSSYEFQEEAYDLEKTLIQDLNTVSASNYEINYNDEGLWIMDTTGIWEESFEELQDLNTVSASNYEINYNDEGLWIMDATGIWGESFEELLPFMSTDAIEEAVFIYLEKHSDISSRSKAFHLENTVSKAYPYMTQDAIQRVQDTIKMYYKK